MTWFNINTNFSSRVITSPESDTQTHLLKQCFSGKMTLHYDAPRSSNIQMLILEYLHDNSPTNDINVSLKKVDMATAKNGLLQNVALN